MPTDPAPTFNLWPNDPPGAMGSEPSDIPTLAHYPAPKDRANDAAVLVCPGGGYGGLADGHEGHDIAVWLNTLGISAIILRYRVAPYKHPVPIIDAQRALRTVRSRAQEWKIDPNRIGIIGFSAGGHLASTTGTHFDGGDSQADDPIERASSRPDFMILLYPVITMKDPHTHQGSRRNLLGKEPDPRLVDLLSNNERVSEATPPTFLVHTSTDKAVVPENSILFYLALRRANVPAELHIYVQGPHGFGLAPGDPVLASWPRRCEDWLRVLGLIPRETPVAPE